MRNGLFGLMLALKSEQGCCVLLYYLFWQAFVQAQHSLLFPLLPINGHKMVQSRDSAPLENIYKGKTKQHARLFKRQNQRAHSSQDLLRFLRFIFL